MVVGAVGFIVAKSICADFNWPGPGRASRQLWLDRRVFPACDDFSSSSSFTSLFLPLSFSTLLKYITTAISPDFIFALYRGVHIAAMVDLQGVGAGLGRGSSVVEQRSQTQSSSRCFSVYNLIFMVMQVNCSLAFLRWIFFSSSWLGPASAIAITIDIIVIVIIRCCCCCCCWFLFCVPALHWLLCLESRKMKRSKLFAQY